MEKDSVSIDFVREALAGVERAGLDIAPVLRKSAIPESLLRSDQSRVSAASFSTLWLAVAQLLDDEFFAQDRRRMKVGSFATLTYLVVGADDLRAALKRACKFVDIVLDDLGAALVVAGDRARLELRPKGSSPLRTFACDTLYIMLHGLMCWLVRRRIPIEQAEFSYPRPPRWREYRSMYSANLRFDAPATAIVFDASLLALPVAQDGRSAREFLRRAPYNIILKYKDASSWSAQLRNRLRERAPDEWPRFEPLAAECGLGASSLRRRLEAEGMTFREIKDGLRRDMAIERLSHGRQSIVEIAQALGFAEPSAFHRAFKQWTGVRPGEYRRRFFDEREPGD